MLLLFLFATDARLTVRRRQKGPPAHHTRSPPTPPSASSDAQQAAQSEGHLFEVLEHIRLYSNSYRPGVIKPASGKLYARLSSTRDRKLFPDDPARDDETVFGAGETDDDDVWVWEAEDDFLLSNVWTDGPDLKKGIIYVRRPSLSAS
ncbi:hypothetical protein BN946_scf184921.g30 [Trametes cinnabarina]|uniref:Uncharacterized protein n=1 Tax=Pycnoporus cinnabarinus TaxID=5643 RepID=A0A060SU62_PYCCI|nr:hypothetical protein BN946_scf184921.g30 [Trametes cinnabarina]